MKTVDVWQRLMDALDLDLTRQANWSNLEGEVLDQAPSRWYVTGFLVPLGAGEEQRADPTAADDFELTGGPTGAGDDEAAPKPSLARRAFFPSSFGLSLLVTADSKRVEVEASWGDYRAEDAPPDPAVPAVDPVSAADGAERVATHWRRTPRTERLVVDLPTSSPRPIDLAVPGGGGVEVVLTRSMQAVGIATGLVPPGTRSVSVYLINHREPMLTHEHWDERSIFQAGLAVRNAEPLVARPNLKGFASEDWDEQVADLQFRYVYEYAVGHRVATRIEMSPDGHCHVARTCWVPSSGVERVAPSRIEGVKLGMEAPTSLAALPDAASAAGALGAFVAQYPAWIEGQRRAVADLTGQRAETAGQLLTQAAVAADRIEAGIAVLGDPAALAAFRLTNEVMARAARRARGPMQGQDEASVEAPRWHPFQLAFVLMNLRGLVEPAHDDRQVVALLFFPTGGGKTEAYLGLAAFTPVHRRLTRPGIASAGLGVLMRYTPRLMTPDQLGRASTLICALALERQADPTRLGEWPFEIGLWVGQAATPNRMGFKEDNNPHFARAKPIGFRNDNRKPAPIPLENCPWCGEKFGRDSFRLLPGPDRPVVLRVVCRNRRCDFIRGQALPIVVVDEAIYRLVSDGLAELVDAEIRRRGAAGAPMHTLADGHALVPTGSGASARRRQLGRPVLNRSRAGDHRPRYRRRDPRAVPDRPVQRPGGRLYHPPGPGRLAPAVRAESPRAGPPGPDVPRPPAPSGDTPPPAVLTHRPASQRWPSRCLPEAFHDPRALDPDQRRRASLYARRAVFDFGRILILSAKITEASQTRAIEAGLLVHHPTVACQLVDHFEGLLAAGLLRLVPPPGP